MSKVNKQTSNVLTITGGLTPLGLDYTRCPESWNDDAGSQIDAPGYIPRGSCTSAYYGGALIVAPAISYRT